MTLIISLICKGKAFFLPFLMQNYMSLGLGPDVTGPSDNLVKTGFSSCSSTVQLLKLIVVTYRRPVLKRCQWPRTVPGRTSWFLPSNHGSVHVDRTRPGSRFIWGQSGLAVAPKSHPRHPCPVDLHKGETREIISCSLFGILYLKCHLQPKCYQVIRGLRRWKDKNGNNRQGVETVFSVQTKFFYVD